MVYLRSTLSTVLEILLLVGTFQGAILLWIGALVRLVGWADWFALTILTILAIFALLMC